MIKIVRNDYWSKSDAFMLPLVGLPKDFTHGMRSYLFWEKYSIEDYKLILTFDLDSDMYCRQYIFPVLDKGGYLLENYVIDDKKIYILDISQWAEDIDKFVKGKYSRLSNEAKAKIEKFHQFGGGKIGIHIYGVLYPNTPMELLNKKTPIEYVAENYSFDYEDLKEIGEIGSIFDKNAETLIIEEAE